LNVDFDLRIPAHPRFLHVEDSRELQIKPGWNRRRGAPSTTTAARIAARDEALAFRLEPLQRPNRFTVLVAEVAGCRRGHRPSEVSLDGHDRQYGLGWRSFFVEPYLIAFLVERDQGLGLIELRRNQDVGLTR